MELLAAAASRIAEGSGKDRDSFGFDFCIVAAVIPPPWGPPTGPGADKLQSSVIQLLLILSCHRAHRLKIPVFSLQAKEPFTTTSTITVKVPWRNYEKKYVSSYWLTYDSRTDDILLLVLQFVLLMRKPCRRLFWKTIWSEQNREADMRGEASVTEACVLIGIRLGTLP